MAKLERRNGIWYARFKTSSGKWKYKSCGKGTVKAKAIVLASEWEHVLVQREPESLGNFLITNEI